MNPNGNGKIYMSEKHLAALRQELMDASTSLFELREERALACEVGGGGRKDGRYLDSLAVSEGDLVQRIARIRQILPVAEIYAVSERNVEVVCLGSIACFMRRPDGSSKKMKQTWEVVGSGETDLRRDRVAYDTPLVSKLMGMNVGDIRQVNTPAGVVEYELIGLYPDWDSAQKSAAPVKIAAAK
jgi:transcription elongation factor GreA